MGLNIDTSLVIPKESTLERTYVDTKKSVSIFNANLIKEYKNEILGFGGLATIIATSLVAKKPLFKLLKNSTLRPNERNVTKNLSDMNQGINTLANKAKRLSLKNIEDVCIKPNLSDVTKSLSGVFRRDLTEQEIVNMSKVYKQIFKIKNKDKFVEKLFTELKKDFGWEKLDIGVDKIDPLYNLRHIAANGIGFNGMFRICGLYKGKNAEIVINNKALLLNYDREKVDIFYTMVHEMTHAKQYELIYRMDKQAFFDYWKNAIKIPQDVHPNLKQEILQKIEEIYEPVWGKLPKIQKGTKEYELAQKYLKDFENYKSSTQIKTDTDIEKYEQCLIEKEAHGTLNAAEKFIQYIFI